MLSRTVEKVRKGISLYEIVKQGDIVLVDFGKYRKGSRNLSGNRPAYILSNHPADKQGSVIMVIPLFRKKSRDNEETDVEIRTVDCKGLRYDEYAQPMNARKIRRYQIMKKIGKVTNEAVHSEILSSMWKQVDKAQEY